MEMCPKLGRIAMLSKFHHYSYGNILLILLQCPYATRVAGFQT